MREKESNVFFTFDLVFVLDCLMISNTWVDP